MLLTSRPIDSATFDITGCRIFSDGRQIQPPPTTNDVVITTTSGTWRIDNIISSGKRLVLAAGPGGSVRFGNTRYRGELHLLENSDGQYQVINHVDMEDYLAGVLPKELYADWSIETYRALAIAARTYALYQKLHHGGDRNYDVSDNQSSQVYGGVSAQTTKSVQAVNDTAGQVLAYGPVGQERIFMTQYSAVNGGVVNGAYVIRDLNASEDIPPLQGGQVDEDGRTCPRFFWPSVRISKTQMYRALQSSRFADSKKLADIKEMRIASRTEYGRNVWLDLVDSQGFWMRIRAEDLRLVLLRSDIPDAKKLYSMNCSIRDTGNAFEFHDGRGFGHGVGLSQWGAQDKAMKGWNARRILEFYYPSSTIIRTW